MSRDRTTTWYAPPGSLGLLVCAAFLAACHPARPVPQKDARSSSPRLDANRDRLSPVADRPVLRDHAISLEHPLLPDSSSVVPSSWVTIPSGTFVMGSSLQEPCRETHEEPHSVSLTHSFEIMTTEVTQGQFQSAMGYNSSTSSSCGGACPVEQVSWHEAAAYCNHLSQKKGLVACYTCTGSGKAVSCALAASYNGAGVYNCPGYRLPTEAEWEYAYRAMTSTAYYNGAGAASGCDSCDANVDLIAWYACNSGSHVQPVGRMAANPWGLFDMAGNVWEWCQDGYQASLGSSAVTNPWGASSASDRVLRGGAWDSTLGSLRAASRGHNTPASRYDIIGFRCVRVQP